jgi:hypothetical protein
MLPAMHNFKLWLSVHDIEVIEETVSRGRVQFHLRLADGNDLNIVFGEDMLENDPDKAIQMLERIVANLEAKSR